MKTEGKRLSERITVALRTQVIGSDAKGQMFADETETLLVTRHGAKLALARELAPEQELTIRCLVTGQEATARVVGQVGTSPEGHLYGIEILDRDVDLWGIGFPPLADSAQAAGRVLLECMACHAREVAYLNDLELEVFQSSHRLSRNCEHCKQATLWGECQHDAPSRRDQAPPKPEGEVRAAQPAVPVRTKNHRKSPRLNVKTGACAGRAARRIAC